MPHSYAETLSLTCAARGRDFDAELWLIVDMAVPPDLQTRPYGFAGSISGWYNYVRYSR